MGEEGEQAEEGCSLCRRRIQGRQQSRISQRVSCYSQKLGFALEVISDFPACVNLSRGAEGLHIG